MVATRDFLSGIIFLAFGAALSWQSLNYQMGSLFQMGPGYFPFLIGIGLAIVGALLTGKAIISGSEALPRIALRPLVLLIGSVVAFAFTLERAGLIVATILLILISRFASSQPMNWLTTAILTACLTIGSVLIFRELLGLPIRIWP